MSNMSNSSNYRVLSDAQVQSFLDNGYLVVKDCLYPDLAKAWVKDGFARLGYDANDQMTWKKDIIWMDHHHTRPVRELAPKAWAAILDVVGGEERLETQVMQIESAHFTTIDSSVWSDAFIVNLQNGADRAWQPPSANVGGWHKDETYFLHYLGSHSKHY
jgi:hypothetical protein